MKSKGVIVNSGDVNVKEIRNAKFSFRTKAFCRRWTFVHCAHNLISMRNLNNPNTLESSYSPNNPYSANIPMNLNILQ